ncbi:XrtB/PEP-CTERM-associated polysaccharide biosynthesis outer membrane protein EpsL [Methylotenera sp.]|uniref:XrtB/PEP-CTERM-associated polysaccharide biosynthesis outer membrane protein EpsL n=1 Tax=Methylotenera sp. TaxID=2051956 RepID=UPI0024895CF8|nr:XrtB/PEP-CTERM-associated polysaccharide biosynthesis outer membrane protein EpsL [Methylotenera sp.]MDI1360983.1 putative exosortase B-associated extracellular polysaccharide biosynthesis transporter EpsL [Methylotenera sp.]
MLHRFNESFVGNKHNKNAFKTFALVISCFLFQCAATSAYADSDDTINFLIGTDYSHYDNLFLLPDGQNPTGAAERSDNVLRTNFGIKVNKKYGLQAFRFDYSHLDSKYDNASFLNFNSNNYKAAWLWSLTPSLKGNLSSERKVDLIPFLDNRNSNTQNIRTLEMQMFDFDWSPHNVWHLLGGYTKLESVNSQTFLQETSFKFNAAEVGVKYSFPSDNFIALKLRKRDGENQEINVPNQVGKDFSENEAELSALWRLSGKSKLTANLGHNGHTDDTYGLRDFSGYFGGVNYSWDASAKLNVGVDLTRKLASYQDFTSSYTVNDVLSIRPTWALTSKVTLGGSLSASKRKFLGDGPIVSATTPTRIDDGVTYGIEATWVPRSTMRFGVNLQHDKRDSNFADRDFSSNTVGINGQLTF